VNVLNTLHKSTWKARKTLVCFLMALPAVYGQQFDISPLFGGRVGGSFKLEEQGQPNFHADLADSFVFGLAGGMRFDGDDCVACNLVEFRWMRQSTHLGVKQDPLLAPTPYSTTTFRPAVTLDHFLGDFTHEFPLEDAPTIRPFLVGTLGAVRMSAPASSATRFVFGIGTGFKVFPSRRWGLRFQAEWLPIVLHAELQQLVCSGGCIIALTGGITNQFDFSVGPVFKF
jgi:hypothetical protein